MRFPENRPSEGSTAYKIGALVADPKPHAAFLTVADVLREQNEWALFGPPEQSALSFEELERVAIDPLLFLSRSLLDRMPSASVETRVILSERDEEFDIHSIRDDQLLG